MLRFMKKTGLWTCALTLMAALLVMGWGLLNLRQVGGIYQALWLPPAQQAAQPTGGGEGADSAGNQEPKNTNKALSGARETVKTIAEQVEGACSATSLFAIAESAAVSVKDGNSITARLEALTEEVQALRNINLYGGRLLYPEEFERGERVALLDEQLAVALFQYAEPLEQEVQIAGEGYRIVGIVRDRKQVGDKQEYSLYIPFLAVEKSSLDLTALCVQAKPIAGAGGWAAFSSAVKAQLPSATLISLPKETLGAALPARILFVAAAMAALLTLLRLLNRGFLALVRMYRERLLEKYAATVLLGLLPRGLGLLVGYGGVALVFAWLFTVLIAPVYTFPEWIPAVLVEPKDISTAFWNVWQGMSGLIELRSPELLRVRFLERIVGWSAGAAALCLGVLWARGLGLIRAKAGSGRGARP